MNKYIEFEGANGMVLHINVDYVISATHATDDDGNVLVGFVILTVASAGEPLRLAVKGELQDLVNQLNTAGG